MSQEQASITLLRVLRDAFAHHFPSLVFREQFGLDLGREIKVTCSTCKAMKAFPLDRYALDHTPNDILDKLTGQIVVWASNTCEHQNEVAISFQVPLIKKPVNTLPVKKRAVNLE